MPRPKRRRSVRLKGYDYSQTGAYYITLVTYGRAWLFGTIVNGVVRLNDYGNIVAEEWLRTPVIRPEIQLDEWIIMPNHIHGIIVINDDASSIAAVGAHGRAPLPPRHRVPDGNVFVARAPSNATAAARWPCVPAVPYATIIGGVGAGSNPLPPNASKYCGKCRVHPYGNVISTWDRDANLSEYGHFLSPASGPVLLRSVPRRRHPENLRPDAASL